MVRGSFSIYRSVYDALMAYPPEEMKEAFRLIGEYALDGALPDAQEGVAFGLFCSVRPLVDRSLKKATAGRSGGLANASKREAKRQQTEAGAKQKEANRQDNGICTEVVAYLNQKAGTSFRANSEATRRLIHARTAEGFGLDQFRTVIDKKVAEWKGTEMSVYLRPQTLFGTKFESYLNQRAGHKAVTKFDNFDSSGTDWNAITAMIEGGQK